MRGLIWAAMLCGVSACADGSQGPGLVVLRNPATGETTQCKGDPWMHWDPFAATEACAKGYEASGWVRASQY